MHEWTEQENEQVEGRTGGWVDGGTEGRVGGQTDGRVGGGEDEYIANELKRGS